MVTCYIIDDEAHAIETLMHYIEEVPELELIGTSENSIIGLNDVKELSPDITFLDVNMPQLSGLEVADLINGDTSVILTTAFPNYALQGFEKSVSDFLLKPISFERFLKSVTKVTSILKQQKEKAATEPDYFFINPGVKGRMIRISYNDVKYIQGLKNYVIIHTANDRHITYLTLKEVEENLPASKFTRIHKSFIINLDHLYVLDGNRVIIDKTEIPIGLGYKENFYKIINRRTLRSGRIA